jgi:hypothetical protein
MHRPVGSLTEVAPVNGVSLMGWMLGNGTVLVSPVSAEGGGSSDVLGPSGHIEAQGGGVNAPWRSLSTVLDMVRLPSAHAGEYD